MVFENHFFTTKEMYREYVNKVLCRRMNRYGLACILIAVSLILVTARSNLMIAVVAGVCLIISLSVLLLFPSLALKQLLELDNNLHGGNRPECVVVFGEQIEMTEGKQRISVQYNQISRIYRLKTCNVLMFSKQNGILYVEDKFAIGNAVELESFLLQRCSQVSRIEKR